VTKIAFSTFDNDFVKYIVDFQNIHFNCSTCEDKIFENILEFILIRNKDKVTYLNVKLKELCQKYLTATDAKLLDQPF
jgi:hypothetical protein